MTITTTRRSMLTWVALLVFPLDSSEGFSVSQSSVSRSIFAAQALPHKRHHHSSKLSATARKKHSETNEKTASIYRGTPSGYRKLNRQRDVQSGAENQRLEMLNHELLTREEELALGGQVVRSNQLQEAMIVLVEQKKAELEASQLEGVNNREDERFLDEWDDLSLTNAYSSAEDGTAFDQDELDSAGMSLLNVNYDDEGYLEQGSYEESLFLRQTNDDPLLDMFDITDDKILSENDIIQHLHIPGGRAELRKIRFDGSLARDKLMRYNVRLVVSIAKRWAKQTMGGVDTSKLVSLYNGGWNRPSLDEAIQEGMVGLARAVDRYDPTRGFKFSTYATYWVTSYIRQCFQSASTGCLRIPSQLHDVKNKYNSILKTHYDTKGTEADRPSDEDIAKEIGVTVRRLRLALRSTQQLVSIDAPYMPGSYSGKGSKAGEGSGGAELLLSDTLQCQEVSSQDQVELTFLRQSLENAMATELSPHERDVVRLRLGLDDGVTRTVREVVEFCGGGLSMADVRSAEQRALKKLRSPYTVHTYKLLAHLDFAGIDVREADSRLS